MSSPYILDEGTKARLRGVAEFEIKCRRKIEAGESKSSPEVAHAELTEVRNQMIDAIIAEISVADLSALVSSGRGLDLEAALHCAPERDAAFETFYKQEFVRLFHQK